MMRGGRPLLYAVLGGCHDCSWSVDEERGLTSARRQVYEHNRATGHETCADAAYSIVYERRAKKKAGGLT